MRRGLWFCAWILVACGGGEVQRTPDPTPLPQEPSSGGSEATPEDPPVSASNPRDLGVASTFADLVTAARDLDIQGAGDSDEGCILRGEGPFRVAADLAVAVRPLPDPPASLSDLAAETGPFRVLSRWGQQGSGRRVLAVITSTPPPREGPTFAVVITLDGVALRSSDGQIAVPPFSLRELPTRLGTIRAARILVLQDGSGSIRRLREVLGVVQGATDAPIALATAMRVDTDVPDPPSRGQAETGMCSVEPPFPEGAPGTIDPADARSALAPVSDGISACMATLSPESASGGRISVRFRVAEGGRVVGACASSDDIRDSGLRACVLDVVRALRFPETGGIVDLEVPFAIQPDRSEAQRGLCER